MSSRTTFNRYEPNSNVPVSTKLWHLIEGTELILELMDCIGNKSHYSHELLKRDTGRSHFDSRVTRVIR